MNFDFENRTRANLLPPLQVLIWSYTTPTTFISVKPILMNHIKLILFSSTEISCKCKQQVTAWPSRNFEEYISNYFSNKHQTKQHLSSSYFSQQMSFVEYKFYLAWMFHHIANKIWCTWYVAYHMHYVENNAGIGTCIWLNQ